MTQNDTSFEELSGEEREKRKSRRILTILGVLFAIGFVLGFAIARAEDVMGFDWVGPWPPEIALGALVIFVVSCGIGTWLMNKQMDDYSKEIHRKSATFAASTIFLGYPVWFLLWKASVVPEPVHWGLFVAGYIAFYLALLFYRYR